MHFIHVTTEDGDPVYIADNACTACGCYQAYVFQCSCGAVHADVCYNCGGFVDVDHDPIETQNDGLRFQWAGRCTSGPLEHTHTHPFVDRAGILDSNARDS